MKAFVRYSLHRVDNLLTGDVQVVFLFVANLVNTVLVMAYVYISLIKHFGTYFYIFSLRQPSLTGGLSRRRFLLIQCNLA